MALYRLVVVQIVIFRSILDNHSHWKKKNPGKIHNSVSLHLVQLANTVQENPELNTGAICCIAFMLDYHVLLS